jgi:probable F420-dependent oxidoreductase
VKFGITFANSGPRADPEQAVALARAAEELGYESLWTVEHVVVPVGYRSEYPYSRSGRMPGEEDVDIPDPLIWLAYVAAITTTLNLATGILILPQRNPVILAKEAATLDVLSGGRFILGVGVGWLREEFDIIGVPFEERAARTDEYVQAMRALWTQGEPACHGRFVDFEGALSHPKPTGRIPVVIGGHTDPAARRAGRLGDGFFPARGKLEELEHLFGVMRSAAKEAGRDPEAIEITAGGAKDLDGARRLADLGVSRIVIPPFGTDPESLRQFLGQFSDRIISKMS